MPPLSQNINIYPLTSPSTSPIPRALQILRPHLPTALALYRRLQFGRFFPDSVLLTNLDLTTWTAHQQDETTTNEGIWLIAFVDRSCRPETEVWVSASWESASASPSTSSTTSNPTTVKLAINPAERAEIHSLLDSLVRRLRSLPLPPSIHTTGEPALTDPGKDTGGLSRDDYASHAANPSIMLFGSIHMTTTHLLKELDVLSHEYHTALVANQHIVFDVGALPEMRKDLPSGLRWGELRPRHFNLVRSRTQIPRQDRTLTVLPSLAIFPEGSEEPISWGFIGLDGSLTTIHVEPEYRGKGLAKAITTKLFRDKMEVFHEEDVRRWAHGIVIVGNVASQKMCESLGGRSLFECYWVRVDLNQVERSI